MNFTITVLFSLVCVSSISALADIDQIKPESKEEQVARDANDVLPVTNLELGEYAYKIVSMDTTLNGDLSSTTILLVGEGELGGAAAYDNKKSRVFFQIASFQLTPVGDAGSLNSARVEHGEISLTFLNRNSGGIIKKMVHYDATSGTLKEMHPK